MKRTALLLASLIILSGFAAAQNQDSQNVDTVIIASTVNFPDAMVSAAPANKLGIPVLLTDKDQLSTSTSDALERLNPSEAIIVGGPAVVSEQVQQDINSRVDSVTRLWGMTQVGTSIEVADYFWSEGSDEAVIVQYPQDTKEGYKLLGAVKNEVQDEDEPILISKPGALSANVLSAVERLGATEVEVYSIDAENVTEDLEEVGVQQVELEEAELEQLRERVENRTRDSLEEDTGEENSTLVIVAAASFQRAISAPSVPNSNSFVVGSQEQVSEALEIVRQTDADRIMVTGKPDLAQEIADRIESETNSSVDHVPGRPDEVAANIARERRREWSRQQQQKYSQWREEVMNSPGIQKAANRTLRKAESAIDSNSSEEAQKHLVEAQEAFQEADYFEAKRAAIKALSEANVEEYRRLDQGEVRERINEEREDLQEAVREMQETSAEFAREVKEAETTEERLEIVQEFREERREQARELREKAREQRQDRMEDRAEVGNSEVKLELEGTELKAEAEYVGPTAGYTWEKSVNRDVSSIDFVFSLSSPNGMAAEVVTDYRNRERISLENGSYDASVTLKVDGETVNQLSRELSVPGFNEYDSEIENEEEGDENETEETGDSESGDSGNVVRYTDSGFEPSTIEIEKGEEVTWVDVSGNDMWVATDVHPNHTEYDGTHRTEHCQDGESDTFDQCSRGEEYSFKFEKTGDWSYHNHVASGTGTVVVK